MSKVRFDPLGVFSLKERSLLFALRDRVLADPLPFDASAVANCSNLFFMHPSVFAKVISSGSRSAIAHLVNGWGNFTLDGKTGVDYLFDDCNLDGFSVTIPQSPGRADSDYHPWQSFAYSSMAGIEPEQKLPRLGLTLRTLAINSRSITVDHRAGDEDLGHLLFAAAHVVPDPNFEFFIDGRTVSLANLIKRAYVANAQENSNSHVCSRYHLTEGLCAATALIPGAQIYHADVQSLLDLQSLRVYPLVAFLHRLISNPLNSTNLNDILFHAGHLLETFSFARKFGYTIPDDARCCLDYCVHLIGERYWRYFDFSNYHLFAHLRRGVTFKTALDLADLGATAYDNIALSDYCVTIEGK